MNCKIAALSTNLHLPLGAANRGLSVRNPVIKRVEKRLAVGKT